MSTDQDFVKKEYKNASGIEKFFMWFIPIGGIGICIIFSLYLFVFKPTEPCDLDKVGAWCKVHPLSMWDIVGLVLFFLGDLWITSLIPRIAIAIGLIDDDSDAFPALNVTAFAFMLIGFLLIWFA